MTRDSIGDLLRAIGQNPTQAEVGSLEETLPGDVDFDSFVKVVKRPDGFRSPGEPEDLIRGFQIFDKDNTGYIGVGELRYGTVMHDCEAKLHIKQNTNPASADIAWRANVCRGRRRAAQGCRHERWQRELCWSVP